MSAGHRHFEDLYLSAQAAILGNDPIFISFLNEVHGVNPEADIAQAVRDLCHIKSRSQLNTDLVARAAWLDLYGQFQKWRRRQK